MQETICPLESRPSVNTVFAKLLVSHIITLIALGHLLRIRGESILSLTTFFFITAPYSIAIRQIITVCYILVTAFLRQSLNAENYIKQHLALLLYTNVRLGEDRRRTISVPSLSGYRNRNHVDTRQIVSTSTFMFKCLATIFIHSRRRVRSVTTLADDKMFELACAGFTIGCLTLMYLFRWPRSWFDLSVPSDRILVHHKMKDPFSYPGKDIKFSSLDVVLGIGRDIWYPPGYVERGTSPWMVEQIYYGGAFSVFTQILTKIPQGLACAIFSVTVSYDDCPPPSTIYEQWARFSLYIGIPMGLISAWTVVLPARKSLINWVISVALIAILIPVWFPLLGGFCLGLAASGFEYVHIHQQIKELSHWPKDEPCPLLWSDSVDGFFGWLA